MLANQIEELRWQQVRSDVYAVCPEVGKIFDEINPTKEHTFFKLCYPFGTKIIDKGVLHLPRKDAGFVPITGVCQGSCRLF